MPRESDMRVLVSLARAYWDYSIPPGMVVPWWVEFQLQLGAVGVVYEE